MKLNDIDGATASKIMSTVVSADGTAKEFVALLMMADETYRRWKDEEGLCEEGMRVSNDAGTLVNRLNAKMMKLLNDL